MVALIMDARNSERHGEPQLQINAGSVGRTKKRGQARRGNKRMTPAPSPCDWKELVADMGAVHLHTIGGAGRESITRQHPAAQAVRCRSEQELLTRKRDGAATAAMDDDGATDDEEEEISTEVVDCGEMMRPFVAPMPGLDNREAELSLGAPPLLPPRLKRARACSYSPVRKFPRAFVAFGGGTRNDDEDVRQ